MRRGRLAFHASISSRYQATEFGPISSGAGKRPARTWRQSCTRLLPVAATAPFQPRIRSDFSDIKKSRVKAPAKIARCVEPIDAGRIAKTCCAGVAAECRRYAATPNARSERATLPTIRGTRPSSSRPVRHYIAPHPQRYKRVQLICARNSITFVPDAVPSTISASRAPQISSARFFSARPS